MRQLWTVLTLVIFLPLFSVAQEFVSPQNQWYTSEGYFNPQGGQWEGNNYLYQFGDSIIEIDNKFYLELTKAEGPEYSNFLPANASYSYYRQTDGQVYVYDETAGTDRLIYDFDMIEGDTSEIWFDQLTVIDSEFLDMADGSVRKQTEFKIPDNDNTSLKVIAGIGDPLNPFSPSPFPIADASYALECFLVNGDLVYLRVDGKCDGYVVSTSSITEEKYRLVKQDDYIHIKGITSNNLQLKMYNMTGQLLQETVTQHNQVLINKDLPSGQVICQLYNGAELIHVQMLFLE